MNESSDSLPLEELEKAPMPSIFSSLRATVSKPLQSVLDIEHYIKCNQRTEMLTQQYRKLMNVDTKLAGNIKRQSIAICPSIQFLPKGRTLEYFDKETYWLMLDYDHVISLILDEKVEKASHSKYAMAVYRTISGKGLRILLKYMRPAGCTLTATELHRLAIDKAMAYFNDLLSINADIQCRDMTRLCGLSHDDKAYFNWNAEPMEITPEEVTKFYNTVVKETLNPDSAPPADASASRPSHRSKSSGKAHDSDGRWQTGIEEITTQVKRLAENWDIRFEPESHNKYLMRFTNLLPQLWCRQGRAEHMAASRIWQRVQRHPRHREDHLQVHRQFWNLEAQSTGRRLRQESWRESHPTMALHEIRVAQQHLHMPGRVASHRLAA